MNKYDIYLRTKQKTERIDDAIALAVLEKVGFNTKDRLPACLDLGQGKLQVNGFFRQPISKDKLGFDGLNFSFPLGLGDSQGFRALSCVFDVSEQLDTEVFDPQVGSVVNRPDMDRILSTWQKTYAFHANVAGTIGLGSGRPTVLDTLPNKFTSTNLKVVLVMGMIILLGALLFRACIDNWLKMQFSL